ncbi:wall-associated receptor kinase-like 8 isoform X3 [Aegilops tauschii subsp. strangulata]
MLKLQEKMTLLLPSVPSTQPQANLLMPMLIVLMALELLVPTVAAAPVALPGCPEACGSVTVPYPFGFRQGCFHKGFNLTCNETGHQPKLFLHDDVEVDAISLVGGTVRVQSKIVNGEWDYRDVPYQALNRNRSVLSGKPYIGYAGSWSGGLTVSTEHNVFVAIGCNFIGYLAAGSDRGSVYVSACATLCDTDYPPPGDTSCSGVGCCRTTISQGLPAYGVQLKDLNQTEAAYAGKGKPISSRLLSGAAFIVDREWFTGINVGAMQNSTFGDFGSPYRSRRSSPKVTRVPTVLEWWLDVKSDRDLVVLDPHSVSGWRCMSLNSFAANIGGAVNKVRCNCSDGYEGNPYIIHGCQDRARLSSIEVSFFSGHRNSDCLVGLEPPKQFVAISLPGMARYDQLTNTAIDRCLQSEKITIGIDKLDMSFQIKHKIVRPLIIPRMARACSDAKHLDETFKSSAACRAPAFVEEFHPSDIDECQLPVYPCVHGTCINMPGTYRCATKKRIISLPGLITAIAVTAGFGLLFSLMGAAKITNKLKQRRAKKLRQKFFKKNHGLLLQQLISSNNDIAERTRIFSLEELEQATNKFDHNRILGGGGHGTVYKGILSDQRIVAIKKAKIIVQREIDQFINEVVILSQTNHRNVVKLFGCCLETEVPLLVYEFISNGALSFHLHGQSENPLSWKDRLRIALETARAIACLHSAASISVYHRDIKCANILLTDTLTSKVSDFGASRSIAIDETGILTAVQGTYGYLDPEYYYTSRLTEKSDVYSFGVILAELLTRVTPVFSSHSSEGTSLASHFVSHIRDNRFSDILDAQIVEEGGAEDAEVVARLAEACLSLKGEERPTMRQVETVLEDVQNSRVNLSSQITRVNRNATNDQPYKGSKGGEETRLYSLEKEFIESSEIPR